MAPSLARQLDLSASRRILDIGGGHGLYSYSLLKKHPQLTAVVIDREPALIVAEAFASEWDVADRVQLIQGDVHSIGLSVAADVMLMANLLHDYDVDVAAALVERFAKRLQPGGRLLVLDALLDSVPAGAPPVSSGPREVAAYSALLFSICEGRCYRLDEVESWMHAAGLRVDQQILSLPGHGSVVTGWCEA